MLCKCSTGVSSYLKLICVYLCIHVNDNTLFISISQNTALFLTHVNLNYIVGAYNGFGHYVLVDNKTFASRGMDELTSLYLMTMKRKAATETTI